MEYTRLHCELDFLESKKFGLLFEKEVNDLLGVNHFSLHLMYLNVRKTLFH